MTLAERAQSVKTRTDLITFLAKLRADLEINKDFWVNTDLGSFLEGMEAWMVDANGSVL
jgi:hypothetical protein